MSTTRSFFDLLPTELNVRILNLLAYDEIAKVSRVNQQWHGFFRTSFDNLVLFLKNTDKICIKYSAQMIILMVENYINNDLYKNKLLPVLMNIRDKYHDLTIGNEMSLNKIPIKSVMGASNNEEMMNDYIKQHYNVIVFSNKYMLLHALGFSSNLLIYKFLSILVAFENHFKLNNNHEMLESINHYMFFGKIKFINKNLFIIFSPNELSKTQNKSKLIDDILKKTNSDIEIFINLNDITKFFNLNPDNFKCIMNKLQFERTTTPSRCLIS